MTEREYRLWLAAESAVRPAAKKALLDRYGTAEEIFKAPAEGLKISGVSPSEAARLALHDTGRLDGIIKTCAAMGIEFIYPDDPAYPERLKHIYDPPAGLFVKGTMPDLDNRAAVAVIGTRRATPYGLRMGRTTAYQIAVCGGIVVSGLTAGVDSRAARGALDAGGICIGVLGTAHDAESGSLAAETAERGAVISEIAPGTPNDRRFFRARNRVAAGLSLGVLVIEAPEKSGTRLFVNDALDQGKDISVLPGNADSPNSAGIFAMMRDGARPVMSGMDVMAEYAPLFPDSVAIPSAVSVPPEKTEPAGRGASSRRGGTAAAARTADRPAGTSTQADGGDRNSAARIPAGLPEDQRRIALAIAGGAAFVDEITEAAGLPVAQVLSRLTLMEIRRIVARDSGKRYYIC